jgi:hypothetical protein
MKRIPVRRNSQGVARVDDHELGTLAAICTEVEIWRSLPHSVSADPSALAQFGS